MTRLEETMVQHNEALEALSAVADRVATVEESGEEFENKPGRFSGRIYGAVIYPKDEALEVLSAVADRVATMEVSGEEFENKHGAAVIENKKVTVGCESADCWKMHRKFPKTKNPHLCQMSLCQGVVNLGICTSSSFVRERTTSHGPGIAFAIFHQRTITT